MTNRQYEVFHFVQEYIHRNNFSPTYREIGEAMGLSSLATVSKHLSNLVAQGLITIDFCKSQSIKIVTQPVPLTRFVVEGPNRLWDNEIKCYWVKEDIK